MQSKDFPGNNTSSLGEIILDKLLGKKLLSEPRTLFTRLLLKLGRGQVKQVLALITGHGHFSKHVHTLGIDNDNQD